MDTMSHKEFFPLLWRTALARETRYHGLRYRDFAVGCRARAGETRDGRPTLGEIIIEWHKPGAHDDDDLSVTGFQLQPRLGSTRVSRSVLVMPGSVGLADWEYFFREGGAWTKFAHRVIAPALAPSREMVATQRSS